MVDDLDSNAMGCLFNKGRKGNDKDESTEQKSKEYSWDKRVKINIEDYTIENVEGGEKGRLPGSVNGQQFIIKNCKDAQIYIFDHTNTVTVDDCTNCKIILGPVKGSVFLRDCKNCVCVLACGQFRIRDCRKMDIFLLCATQPIIESSTAIHFACMRLFYTNLEDQFNKSKLSIYNNNWSNIHDFTPMEGGGSNWCLLPSSIKLEDYMQLPSAEDFTEMKTSFSAAESVVPYTHGPQKMPDSESCLAVVFSHDKQAEQSRALINKIRSQSPECLLMRTKEIQLQQNDSQRIFSKADFNDLAGKGPVVGLHFNGPNCIQLCQKAADSVADTAESKKTIYLGSNAQTSHAQVESFFNYANMKLEG